jgi:bifunctional pyridoxal-dependent enzyme with beta-cystathionase and maltose regulon repressor activities
MDFDENGKVDVGEFRHFVSLTHEKRGEKGDRWLRSLLHTLETNMATNDAGVHAHLPAARAT